ncbi:serine/threonine protein kinase [Xylanibacillus composti]|uniref:Serine/threonine protein kinase n=1 Tax=Xylanibacillus composti TaxID=1572762 RepID=A0A8J4M1C6_9BACL|nr:stage VI sporulation protein F [Xylanibacillus composti]MDT9725609.1 serine/threonine protein kinase [Xylanibacillus composti]GIQ67702.1 hypothetical protein XYCOK13_05260 [Xylanibacillus composti]
MAYTQYGIRPELVEMVKTRLKSPERKEKLKLMVKPLTKKDLQDRATVAKLVGRAAKVLNIAPSSTERERIVSFILDQKIDPKNTLHLIKLWGMFR